MNQKTLFTVAITLLVAYTFAKTQIGNNLLSVQRDYFR